MSQIILAKKTLILLLHVSQEDSVEFEFLFVRNIPHGSSVSLSRLKAASVCQS